jgi:hypothetical protein
MTGIFLVLVTVGAVLTGALMQPYSKRLRQFAAGLMLTYVTIVFLLGAGELFFRFAHAESDGLPTLASQNWLARYWQKNSAGYRDTEWDANTWNNRERVLVVGDSFAAGWGIDDPSDRFSDVLATQLGDTFAVINLGMPGASTVEEIQHLRDFPLADPDVVVLQYYLNDIENAALSIGLDPGLNPAADIPAWASESYLGNFLYWRWIGLFRPTQEGTQAYWEWLYGMYDNTTVWDIHTQQLTAFYDEVIERDASLIVVIFPNLLDPVGSIPYVDRVAQFFESQGMPNSHIIKLFDVAAQMSASERIVSRRDAHASVSLHRYVGQQLFTVISQP